MQTDWAFVIPVLNEKATLPSLIDSLRRDYKEVEWIVVDGGSDDGTWQWLLDQDDIKKHQSAPGRGTQMDHGARQSERKYILFLHADSQLPSQACEQMEVVLSGEKVSAGAFRFSIDHPGWAYRLMEFLVAWRSKVFQMPYGDQGLFLTRDVYETVGGLKEIPLMEDVDLCQRLKEVGRITLSKTSLKTSSRRIEKRGFWSSCARNIFLVMLFRLKVSPEKLKRIYDV